MKLWMALGLALAVGACAGQVPAPSATPTTVPTTAPTPSPTAETHDVHGIVTVVGLEHPDLGTCRPNKGYEDVSIGTNVVVKDQAGTIIGSGSLTLSPQDAPDDFVYWDATEGGFPCRLAYLIPVPKAEFYHISIGRRDGPTESYADMSAAKWQWDLSLGS